MLLSFKKGICLTCTLLFIDKDNKVINADCVDTINSAEILDKVRYPRLFSIVKQFMIHGPCGKQNANSPCMDSKTKIVLKIFRKHLMNKLILIAMVIQIIDEAMMGNKFHLVNKKST